MSPELGEVLAKQPKPISAEETARTTARCRHASGFPRVPGGDEGAALGRHGSQLGSEGGQGGQEERGEPPATQPCTPALRKGLLTAATSEQGAVGCKRERDKGVSGERLGGRLLCGGVTGGCQLGLSTSQCCQH